MQVVAAPLTAQFLLMMFLIGGTGVPLGTPPEREDPMLAAVAPDECLYYTTWAGMARPDPKSPNHTERLLAEEEIQELATEIESRVKRTLGLMAGGDRDARAALTAELIPMLGKVLLTRPTAIFVSEFRLNPQGAPDIQGAMVVNLGDARADVEAAMGKLREEVFEQWITDVEIGGREFQRFQPDPQVPLITWGIEGEHLVLGVGQGAVEGVLQRARTPAPRWLAELQTQLPVERRATLTYANLKGMLGIAMPLAGDPQVIAMIDALGLGQLELYGAVTGLDESGVVSKTLIEIDGRPEGLLSLLTGEPLSRDDLAPIPHDSIVAFAVRLDGQKLLDTIAVLMGQVEPRAARDFLEGLALFEQDLGFKIREDLLGSLGGAWRLYTSPREGGLLTGWTAAVSVRDRAKAMQVHDKLIGAFPAGAIENDRAPRIKSMQFKGQAIHSLVIPDDDFFVTPSWCLTRDELLFALFPQAIKAHISRDESEKSLADASEVAQLFRAGEGPLLLGYHDTRSIFRTVYPLMQFGLRVAAGELLREGVDLDLTLLPSASSIGKHLQPGVIAARLTDEGLFIESRQTLPGGSVGAAVPVAAAFLLPAVHSAHQAASRTQSMNNLKQIGLALHNYHDTFKGFPASYNTDKNGKPLLSWRVHILPYIEQQELYRQFHFDEPWDSEHNRKLIRLMPTQYKSPGSTSDPGKTNYLGVRGDGGVMPPPKDEDKGNDHPLGVRLAAVRDGASNTIAVVEASDQLAVIWTKPDDFDPDTDNPIRGLVGVRPGVFLAAMCDGSVREVSESVAQQVLEALFTRDGGEPVNRPF